MGSSTDKSHTRVNKLLTTKPPPDFPPPASEKELLASLNASPLHKVLYGIGTESISCPQKHVLQTPLDSNLIF